MVDTRIIRTRRKPWNKQLPTNEFFDRRNSKKTARFFVCKNSPQKNPLFNRKESFLRVSTRAPRRPSSSRARPPIRSDGGGMVGGNGVTVPKGFLRIIHKHPETVKSSSLALECFVSGLVTEWNGNSAAKPGRGGGDCVLCSFMPILTRPLSCIRNEDPLLKVCGFSKGSEPSRAVRADAIRDSGCTIHGGGWVPIGRRSRRLVDRVLGSGRGAPPPADRRRPGAPLPLVPRGPCPLRRPPGPGGPLSLSPPP